jgi:hypothetical protein
MPELKAAPLLVGRKALHSKPAGGSPFGSRAQGYVPSQLEGAKAKPAFQVRTDWKAKYLK